MSPVGRVLDRVMERHPLSAIIARIEAGDWDHCLDALIDAADRNGRPIVLMAAHARRRKVTT